MSLSPVQPAHGCGDAPVDLVHLSRQTLGNRALEREVLGLFATQSVSCANRLGAALHPDDAKIVVHTLKGSAQGIGAWRVVAAARSVEDVVRNNPEASAEDEKAVLIREVAATNAYIVTLLADT